MPMTGSCTKSTQAEQWTREGLERYREKRYPEAVELFQKAAELGNYSALSNLGNCYYYGHGVPENAAKARELFGKAEKHDVNAAMKIGDMIVEHNISGVAADACAMYQKAYELAKTDRDPQYFPDICLRLARYQKEHKVEMLSEAILYYELREDSEEDEEETDLLLESAEEMLVGFRPTDRMLPVAGTDFRLMNDKVLYIHCPEFMRKYETAVPQNEGDTGVICYAYIHEKKGLCFRFLCSAYLNDDGLAKGKSRKADRIVFRRRDLQEAGFLDLGYIDVDTSEFDNILKHVQNNDITRNPDKEDMRGFAFLDPYRSENWPDNVRVVFDSKRPKEAWETLWVRCEEIGEHVLYGTLLKEPEQGGTYHKGDTVGFTVMYDGNRNRILMAVEKK